MEDAWDWVQEELKKIQEDMPENADMMQVVDAISVADFWKRRYDEELMLWERKLEMKEDEKKNFQSKAQVHEKSINELDWKLKELERRWDHEKLLLEDRLYAKEAESELEKTKFQWESRLKVLEDENKSLKIHLGRMEGVALAPSTETGIPEGMDFTKMQSYKDAEKRLKEREERVSKSEEEVRDRLENLQKEKQDILKNLAEKEKELEAAKETWDKIDKEVNTVSLQMSKQLASLRIRETEHFVILEDLARGFAHRVRNHLGIMSGTVQLSIASYKLEPDLEDQLKVVDNNVQEMLKSIEDFLNLARIPEMAMVMLNMGQFMEAVIQQQETKLGNQRIKILRNFDEALPKFRWDQKMFEEAFGHLLQNSVEALPQGGEISVSIQFDNASGCISIKIADNGSGIGENHIKKIFQPYFTSKKNHRGLGLTIAKRVIDLHKGTLSVESVKGKGTTVKTDLFLETDN